jgi:hypothetical protein
VRSRYRDGDHDIDTSLSPPISSSSPPLPAGIIAAMAAQCVVEVSGYFAVEIVPSPSIRPRRLMVRTSMLESGWERGIWAAICRSRLAGKFVQLQQVIDVILVIARPAGHLVGARSASEPVVTAAAQ